MSDRQTEKEAKLCPHCGRIAFRTMTDYLCVSGCRWHERHDEPIPISPPEQGASS